MNLIRIEISCYFDNGPTYSTIITSEPFKTKKDALNELYKYFIKDYENTIEDNKLDKDYTLFVLIKNKSLKMLKNTLGYVIQPEYFDEENGFIICCFIQSKNSTFYFSNTSNMIDYTNFNESLLNVNRFIETYIDCCLKYRNTNFTGVIGRLTKKELLNAKNEN